MLRCIHLAKKGTGNVAPNPMVGAVLVYNNKIIGEGYHEKYGAAHAEVNCINNAIQNGYESLIPKSVLYVSLEPCTHFGKTPPCADLIIRHCIPKVVIGSIDPFEAVNGKGIERLKAAGTDVIAGVLDKECRELNKRFFTFHEKKRPYLILKWAETADGKIAGSVKYRLKISNPFSDRLVHRWRSEEASILVGTNTALADNPQLNTRLWPGPSPVRIVLDMSLRLPGSLNLFDGTQRTIVLNSVKEINEGNTHFLKMDIETDIAHSICKALYSQAIQSVFIEGGARLLQSFIDAGLWDEIRIISSAAVLTGNGLAAPVLPSGSERVNEIRLSNDRIVTYRRMKQDY